MLADCDFLIEKTKEATETRRPVTAPLHADCLVTSPSERSVALSITPPTAPLGGVTGMGIAFPLPQYISQELGNSALNTKIFFGNLVPSALFTVKSVEDYTPYLANRRCPLANIRPDPQPCAAMIGRGRLSEQCGWGGSMDGTAGPRRKRPNSAVPDRCGEAVAGGSSVNFCPSGTSGSSPVGKLGGDSAGFRGPATSPTGEQAPTAPPAGSRCPPYRLGRGRLGWSLGIWIVTGRTPPKGLGASCTSSKRV